MAQRSASQPTGTQRTFGRKQYKPLLVLMALMGLALAIGLTYFLSQAIADDITGRQRSISTPVNTFARSLKSDIGEMRRLEESFIQTTDSGDFSSNVILFWKPYSELNQSSYRNLVVLERALDIGFDGQQTTTANDTLSELQAAGAAVNAIVLGFAERAEVAGNLGAVAEIEQQIADNHAVYSQALLNINANLNSIINLAESDQNNLNTVLGQISTMTLVVMAALVVGTLLWIGRLLLSKDEQIKASDHESFSAFGNVQFPELSPLEILTAAGETGKQPFFNRIQNQLLVVFLAMVGLILAIGITSVLSQETARRTSARLINIDTPIAQYALDFKGELSEMRRLEETYTLNLRSEEIQQTKDALLIPWNALRINVIRRTLVLEQALNLGFDGLLAETMRSSWEQIDTANDALAAITLGNEARNDLFVKIEERSETISILSVLLSFANENQQELRTAAQVNDLSLTLLSRDYLISGELSKLNEYEALVNSQFIEGDPMSELRADSVRDFRALFALDQEIIEQRALYALALERVNNNLNNIIDLTVSDQSAQEAALNRSNSISTAIIVALIVATLIPIGLYMMTSGGRTSAQIESLQNTVASVQKGDFSVRAKIISRDETRFVATEMNEMLDTTFSLIESGDEQRQLQTAILQLLEDVSDVADGDMTIRAYSEHPLTIPMAQAFNETVSQLHDLLTEVGVSTNTVDRITLSSTESTTELTSNSQSQIDHIIDTTAAVDEMAVSIQHVSRNADQSAEVSQSAQNSAAEGVQAVQNSISGLARIQSQTERSLGQINRLSEASQNISRSITLIDEISDQTSVLALNASIRALAAGEDGRGFTVVAREIEDLSTQASQAAQRVAQLTAQIQNNAVLATNAMSNTQTKLVANRKIADEAASHMQSLETVTEKFSGIINEIRSVTRNQAQNSEVVALSMNEIANSTKQTVAGSQETIQSLESLAVLTNDLRSSISLFKLNSAENELASNEAGAVTA